MHTRPLALTLLFLLAWTPAAHAQWVQVRVDTGIKAALALGPDCTAEVSYMLEANEGYVRHARIAAGEQPEITPVATGYFYGPLDVAADTAGGVYINYHDHDLEDQVVASRQGNTWSLERIEDAGHDGWDNSILITDEGILHTSSVDPSGFGGRGVEHARRSPNGTWNVTGVGSPSIMYAHATSIVIGANGEPAIAYYNDGTADLELAERARGNWTISVVDSTDDVGRFPSLALDKNGDLHVAYYQHLGGGGAIRYAHRSNGAWTITDVDTLSNIGLGFAGARRIVALALDETNTAHLVYGDQVVIRYAHGTPGNWTYETVLDETDTGTRLGQQVDMARCPKDGSLHIVYHAFGSDPEGTVWYVRPMGPVGVEDVPLPPAFDVALFPHPAAGTLTLQVTGEPVGHEGSVTVFDPLGRKVLARKLPVHGASNLRIPLGGLPPGVYLVQVRIGNDQRTSPFVIAHR